MLTGAFGGWIWLLGDGGKATYYHRKVCVLKTNSATPPNMKAVARSQAQQGGLQIPTDCSSSMPSQPAQHPPPGSQDKPTLKNPWQELGCPQLLAWG